MFEADRIDPFADVLPEGRRLENEILYATDPALLPPDRDAAATAFADAINAKLADSRSKDIVVYVHGYKVPFENPLLVATELWHFMGYDGVVIPYS